MPPSPAPDRPSTVFEKGGDLLLEEKSLSAQLWGGVVTPGWVYGDSTTGTSVHTPLELLTANDKGLWRSSAVTFHETFYELSATLLFSLGTV